MTSEVGVSNGGVLNDARSMTDEILPHQICSEPFTVTKLLFGVNKLFKELPFGHNAGKPVSGVKTKEPPS